MKIVRKTYDWVLHWAKTPYGAIALFALAFAESSFFPIPPDVLLIALCLGAQAKAFRYASICTAASIVGGLAGYAIGYFIWLTPSGEFTSVATFFFSHIPSFTEAAYFDIKDLYDRYDFWIIFTAGFTPIPYKIFTVSAGAFDVNLPMFMVASVLSRGGRFFLIAFLIWKFGPSIERFIDRYFNWLAIAFTVLLVGGFVLIKYLL